MENICLEETTKTQLKLVDVLLPEDVELKKHAVLFPPMPCCAQLAAPFWAKVIGSIVSKRDKELLIETTIILYDQDKHIIKECSDSMFLEDGGEVGFDIQIPHLVPIPSMYSIKVDIKEEM
ncbi:MAG TPA: hypothetical protein PLR38_10615 [Syntrophorhabdaceae bacterium]|nr:hypothetical protein [Syntrophorhabdaceae bacterium]HOL06292.1 hypothetical protein [Syntrophorhabdaceae bacterium]HPP42926.1 hypothetical protein [Syntrophorhabdaceae bacterium]